MKSIRVLHAHFHPRSAFSCRWLLSSALLVMLMGEVSIAGPAGSDALTTCLRDAEKLVEMKSKKEDTDVGEHVAELEREESKFVDALEVQSGRSEKLKVLEKKRAELVNVMRLTELVKQRLNKVNSSPATVPEDKKTAEEANKLIESAISTALNRKDEGVKSPLQLDSEIAELKNITPETARKNLALIREKREKLARNWDDFDRQWQQLKARFQGNRCEPRLKLEDKWKKEFDSLEYSSSPTECVRITDRASTSLQAWKAARSAFDDFKSGEYSMTLRAAEIVRDPKVMAREVEKVENLRKVMFFQRQFVVMSQEGEESAGGPNEFSRRLGQLMEEHPFITGIAAIGLIRTEVTLKTMNEQLEKLKNLVEQLKGQSETDRAAFLARAEEKHRRLKTLKDEALQSYLKFFKGNNQKRCVDISVDFDSSSGDLEEKESGSRPENQPTKPASRPENRPAARANSIK